MDWDIRDCSMTVRKAEFGPWSKISGVKTWRPNAAHDDQPKVLTNEPAWGVASNPDEVSDKITHPYA